MARFQNTLIPALILAAGCTLSGQNALAQNNSSPYGKQPEHGRAMTAQGKYALGSTVVGASIRNASDESLGSIDDLVIDRGSGLVRFALLKTGTVLGMGGRTIAVPFNSLNWDSSGKHILLNSTPETIKTWPTFDKDAWSRGDRSGEWYTSGIGRAYANDPNAWKADSSSKVEKIQGRVQGFTRRTGDNGSEQLIVTVATPGGSPREVALGPSWYMAGNNSIAFFRDSPVEITVYQVDPAGKSVPVAQTVSVNGKQMRFYSNEGRPQWAPENRESSENMAMTMPLVLYTEVIGKDVDCRGEACGKVKDGVVQFGQGRVSFLVIDPDQNFLGIADQNRIVPWTIVTRSTDGKVHLDANKSMIVNGPQAPKDLSTFMGGEDVRAYEAYATSPADQYRSRQDRP